MIVLMGVKHSGKTSLGRMLAKELNIPFWDLDNLLEEQYREDKSLSFREIYKKLGEEGFRDLEYRAVQNFDFTQDGVLALGGGTVENIRAMELIKKAQLLIFLDTEESVLWGRIEKNGIPPFLSGSPETLFHELFIRRRKLYNDTADIILELKDESRETVLTLLEKAIEDKK